MITNLYMLLCKALFHGHTITSMIRRETRKEPLVMLLAMAAIGALVGSYLDGDMRAIAIACIGLALGLLLGHLYW